MSWGDNASSPRLQRPDQRGAVTPSEKLRRWRRDEDQVEVLSEYTFWRSTIWYYVFCLGLYSVFSFPNLSRAWVAVSLAILSAVFWRQSRREGLPARWQFCPVPSRALSVSRCFRFHILITFHSDHSFQWLLYLYIVQALLQTRSKSCMVHR